MQALLQCYIYHMSNPFPVCYTYFSVSMAVSMVSLTVNLYVLFRLPRSLIKCSEPSTRISTWCRERPFAGIRAAAQSCPLPTIVCPTPNMQMTHCSSYQSLAFYNWNYALFQFGLGKNLYKTWTDRHICDITFYTKHTYYCAPTQYT